MEIREAEKRELIGGRKLQELKDTLRALSPTAKLYQETSVAGTEGDMNLAEDFVAWMEKQPCYTSKLKAELEY